MGGANPVTTHDFTVAGFADAGCSAFCTLCRSSSTCASSRSSASTSVSGVAG